MVWLCRAPAVLGCSSAGQGESPIPRSLTTYLLTDGSWPCASCPRLCPTCSFLCPLGALARLLGPSGVLPPVHFLAPDDPQT